MFLWYNNCRHWSQVWKPKRLCWRLDLTRVLLAWLIPVTPGLTVQIPAVSSVITEKVMLEAGFIQSTIGVAYARCRLWFLTAQYSTVQYSTRTVKYSKIVGRVRRWPKGGLWNSKPCPPLAAPLSCPNVISSLYDRAGLGRVIILGWGSSQGLIAANYLIRGHLHLRGGHLDSDVHCTALQCTVHCTALKCTALHCTSLQCTALCWAQPHCITLQCPILYWPDLQITFPPKP